MKKILFYVSVCALILVSCKNNENPIPECSVENPLEELEWLKEIKNSLNNCTCQISILQGKYRESTVFYLMITDPLCNSVFQVTLWDCNGNVVKEYKSEDADVFSSEVELINNIYTCHQ
jgi:hypothetical protein